jgi:MFS family permease
MMIAFQKYLWSFWSSDKADTTRLDGSVRAHVWYLWKLQGRSYPVIIAGMLIIGSIVVMTQDNVGMAEFKPDPRMRLEPIMALWWMTLFAVVLGIGFGMLNPDSVTSIRRKKTVEESLRDFHVLRMGSFLSSLPISNEQLSRAILMTITRASLTSIALSLFAFVVISIFKIDLVSGLWQSSFAGWYWLGLFFIPWAAMGCSATVCLFGRVPLVVAVTAALVGIIVLAEISSTQQWCILILSIASVLTVLGALAIGLRSGLLSARTIAVAVAGWISLLLLSCISSPLELTNWILSWLVLLATVAILPIIVMPVAIAFNRHR